MRWRHLFLTLTLAFISWIPSAQAQLVGEATTCKVMQELIGGYFHQKLACQNVDNPNWTVFEFFPAAGYSGLNFYGWVPGQVSVNSNFNGIPSGYSISSFTASRSQIEVWKMAGSIYQSNPMLYNPLYQNCAWFVGLLMESYGSASSGGGMEIHLSTRSPFGGCYRRGYYSDQGWDRCGDNPPQF